MLRILWTGLGFLLLAGPMIGQSSGGTRPKANRERRLYFVDTLPLTPGLREKVRTVVDSANLVLERSSCVGRGGCPLTFKIAGLNTAHAINGTITHKRQFIGIRPTAGTLVVLASRIHPSFCQEKGLRVSGPGRVLGCADWGLGRWIILQKDWVEMPVSLVHEYGHAAGLQHRNQPGALMNEYYDDSHTCLLAWECSKLVEPNNINSRKPSRKQ